MYLYVCVRESISTKVRLCTIEQVREYWGGRQARPPSFTGGRAAPPDPPCFSGTGCWQYAPEKNDASEDEVGAKKKTLSLSRMYVCMYV